MLPVIAWLYAPVLARLFAVWMHSPFYSHGIFVPVFALLVLWRDRKKLKAIEATPSWAGLPLVGLALLMRHSTVLKGDFFFSGVSLLLLVAGLVILLYGREFFRAVLFPWAFLILMIPLPGVIIHKVTFSLGAPTLKLSAFLLQLVGIPLVREGNLVIVHANSHLFILGAESGILSLLTPLTVAIMHGYLADNRKWVRAVLACSSVPIAIVADSFRIVGTCLLAQFWGPDAELFFSYSGLLIFAVSLIMLFILHRLILRIWGGSPGAKYPMQLPATITSTLG